MQARARACMQLLDELRPCAALAVWMPVHEAFGDLHVPSRTLSKRLKKENLAAEFLINLLQSWNTIMQPKT